MPLPGGGKERRRRPVLCLDFDLKYLRGRDVHC